jgi:hypothetical protein
VAAPKRQHSGSQNGNPPEQSKQYQANLALSTLHFANNSRVGRKYDISILENLYILAHLSPATVKPGKD